MMQEFTQAIRADGIESLAENRNEIADESLARWREAYLKYEDSKISDVASPTDSIDHLFEDSTPQSPVPSSTQSQSVAKSTSEPAIQTTTIMRHEPYGSFLD